MRHQRFIAAQQFAIDLRYQTTDERAFFKALTELQKSRNERRGLADFTSEIVTSIPPFSSPPIPVAAKATSRDQVTLRLEQHPPIEILAILDTLDYCR